MDNLGTALEFRIDYLGFDNEPLDSRMLVMSKILKELGIQYKRYYVRKNAKNFRRVRKPNPPPEDLSISFVASCDEAHLKYASYLYKERMKTIIKLQKSFNAPSDLDK